MKSRTKAKLVQPCINCDHRKNYAPCADTFLCGLWVGYLAAQKGHEISALLCPSCLKECLTKWQAAKEAIGPDEALQ